jgi:hypothetical protein
VLPFPAAVIFIPPFLPFEAADRRLSTACTVAERKRARVGESQKSFIVFDPLLVMNECDL